MNKKTLLFRKKQTQSTIKYFHLNNDLGKKEEERKVRAERIFLVGRTFTRSFSEISPTAQSVHDDFRISKVAK